MTQPQPQKQIVIIGGGIIGCTIAYYLTRHPQYDATTTSITLLEASSIAAGASGKAGGLLADWAYPKCLAERSFNLHQELAREHNGAQAYGYREVHCGTVTARVIQDPVNETTTTSQPGETPWEKLPKQDLNARNRLSKDILPRDLNYIDPRNILAWQSMGGRTAQVHPLHFTQFLSRTIQSSGVQILLRAHADSITYSPTDAATAVTYHLRDSPTPITLPATHVIVAAGPWTSKLLPAVDISSVRAHSVVYEADVAPYAIFTSIRLPDGYTPAHRTTRRHKKTVDPEAYARPFSEIYACGEVDTRVPLPPYADAVTYDEAACDDVTAYMSLISPVIRKAPVKAKQACYLPQCEVSEVSGPVVGKVKGSGVYVAAGHSCWGVQNAPATGKTMAELVLTGKSEWDLRDVDPKTYGL